MFLDDLRMPRQQVIRGAGVALAAGALAACAKDDEKPAATGESTTTPATHGSGLGNGNRADRRGGRAA